MSRHLVTLLLAAVAVSCHSACSRLDAGPLRIGINAWPGYEFLYLAQVKGFYREEGVEVRLVEFNSLSDSRRAYERGQIDGMGATMIEVMQARENSARSPQIVQVVDYSNGADVMLARPGIATCEELKGKRIGVELSSLGVYVLARGLENHGLSLEDVEIVSMDQSGMEEAMRQGELDAVVTYPPVSTKLLRNGATTEVFSTAEIPGEVIDLIAIEQTVNLERSAEVAKLLQAFHRAVVYSRQNPADAWRIMAEREGITPAEFGDALTNGIQVVSQAEQAAYLKPGGGVASLVDAADRVLRRSGQITGRDRRAASWNAAFAAAP